MPQKTYNYTVLIHPADPDETGYWAEVPALPGCFTQGQTVEQCLDRVKEAIALHLEVLVERGQPIPEEPQREGALVHTVVVPLPAA